MIVTVNWIENNYNKFNKLYFRGSLPVINFKTNKSCNTWGFASFKYDYRNSTIIPKMITMSTYYDCPEKVLIQTLLHEMIHIADYTWHPEHFIKNGKRISGHHYNAHGVWFLNEAKRISNESGYSINNHVTAEEKESSSLSNKVKELNNRKIDKALICVVNGTTGAWYFKTDIDKSTYLKTNLRNMYNWKPTIGEFKNIKFYTFDDPIFASRRSCKSRIYGWRLTKSEMTNKLIKMKATDITNNIHEIRSL